MLESRSFVSTALLLLGSSVAAQDGPLNLPLSRLDGGSVHDARITPDGSRVVYAADQNVIGEVELFSVPLKGDAAAIPISPPIPNYDFGGAELWKLSPDSRHAFYVSDNLYRVPIDGRGSPVRLSDAHVRPSYDFRIAPDGTRVVFRGVENGRQLRSLYSVPSDGSAAPVLLQAASDLGGVIECEISPDGAAVVFCSFHEDGLRSPFYSVPIAGGPVARLSQPSSGTGHFQSMPWSFSASARRVVFLSALEASSVPELYSVPLDGSALPKRLNGALVAGGSVLEFQLSPDGRWAVYVADQRRDGTQELFGVPVDGSAPARALHALLASDRDVSGFAIHRDSHWVVYRSDHGLDDRFELYGTAVDGQDATVELSPPISPNEDVGWFGLTPDGRRLVLDLTRGSGSTQRHELWQVSLAPGLPQTKLVEEEESFYHRIRIAPDGRHVLYQVRGRLSSIALDRGLPPRTLSTSPVGFDVDARSSRAVVLQPVPGRQVYELFSIPIDASRPPVKLNGPLALGEIVADVASFQPSADGRWLVYHMNGLDRDEEPGVADGLVSVRTDGSQAPVRLYPPPRHDVRMDDIVAYRIDAASERVVFLSGDVLSEFDEEELYSVPIDGSRTPTALNRHHFGMRRFELSRDGEWVVYAVDLEWGDGIEMLYSSRTDGTALELQLSGALAVSVDSFAISPDGGSVVYIARRTATSRSELFRVPIDGSAPPVLLASPLVAGGDVLDFQIDPSSRWVVCRGDLQTNQVDELWKVPLLGGVAPTRLNGALVAGGDVVHYRLSSDGSRVVYSADQLTDQALQLFAAPITGGAAWSVTPPFLSGAKIFSLQIAPGDARVLYVADAATAGVRELFVAPLDGSAAPRRLSGALVTGGDVVGLPAISSDGSRVVFLADARVDETVELFGSRLEPDAPRELLSGPLGPGGDVLAVRLAPDGARVAYLADASTDETVELFGVPIEGQAGPRRLCAKLDASRDVEPDFTFDARSQRVFYVADELADEVRELFAASLAPVPRRWR